MEHSNRLQRRKRVALKKRRRRLFALLVFSSIIISLLTYNFFARAGSKAPAHMEPTANKEEAASISNDNSKLSDNLPSQEGSAEEPASKEEAKEESQQGAAASKTSEAKPAVSGQDTDVIAASSEDKNLALTGKIICIDPGHQAKANLSTEPIGPGSTQMKAKVTGGTSGVSSRIPEYQINLDVSMKLKELLERAGAKVVMTRAANNVNISNAERAELANKASVDISVRIHANGSSNFSASGISILYPAKNEWTGGFYAASKEAAQIVLDELIKSTGAKREGIVARGDITGFNWAKDPVILVEMGYLSNKGEDALLNTDDYQRKVAQGIFNGISEFLLS
ncbi:MAG: N-acetylmuramoyl-L-alanine amidase [Actinomycetota bacterium]|nr:N-acetylmuramoyl-L-alanine amidase [Actinomycetota bacterium]